MDSDKSLGNEAGKVYKFRPDGQPLPTLTPPLAEAFPELDPGLLPLGPRVLVQLRRVMSFTAGGIALPDEVQETEKSLTVVARVIKLGPLAFCHRDTLEPWAEGIWARPGDFVRVPKWGGDRVEVPFGKDTVKFAIINDHELIAKVQGDPLAHKEYVR